MDFNKTLNNKTVLITGGTGTFGKACIKYLRDNHPSTKIRVFSRDEFKQANLRASYGDDGISYLLGDVRDINRLRLAFAHVDYVIHAAALKHVGLGEYNPTEFVCTNVQGTENVCRAAIDTGVDRVVVLSSDKGVNPINLYGATKLVAEKIAIQYNGYSPHHGGARFMAVRYGNVAGSRGSAIGIFRRCIERGEVIPITDNRMTRFWMTIEDAVGLVMHALNNNIRGSITIPSLYAFNIMDLVSAVLGRCPTMDDVKFIGMRPGEKLHEHLMTRDERTHALTRNDLYMILPQTYSWFCEKVDNTWKHVPNMVKYSSFHWPHRLSSSALRNMIQYIESE